MKSIYLTTPIYYASGSPHLGHTHTTVLVDSLMRYYRLKGYQTRFSTGMDEHGLKINRLALQENKSPQEFVGELASEFKNLWNTLGIEYDDFITTSELRHKKIAGEFWNRMKNAGDIYLGKYEGLYCVECEQYYLESDLSGNPICPIHNRALEKISEDSYFFKLSKYQKRLIDYIQEHPDFIIPETRKNEVMSFLTKHTLQDLSISRTSFSWGIPVPENPSHVMYVWVDALVNYISSLGGTESDLFKTFWPNAIHVLAKDILRFHAIYWPCMLFSAGLSLPKTMLIHGWWTVNGKKISKSDPATRVDPTALSQDITADGLKYYLLSSMILGRDGDFDYHHLILTLNVDLANNLGNLCHRVASMSERYLGDIIPACNKNDMNELDRQIEAGAYEMAKTVESSMEGYNPSKAIEAVMKFTSSLNLYLDKTAPWQLAKLPDGKKRLVEIFNLLAESLRWIAAIGSPFFPKLSKALGSQLGFGFLEWPQSFELGEKKIKCGAVLFKRIGKDDEEALIGKWLKGAPSTEN